MQSLGASLRLVQRQRIDNSRIGHFRSIGACPLSCVSGFSSLASDNSASAKTFGNSSGSGSSKGSLLQHFSNFYRSSASFTTMSCQIATSTSSSEFMLFNRPQSRLLRGVTVSPSFPRRCITTGANPVESATQDSTMSMPDVPTRIKFKRLDKTAKHIMQILDKEAVQEVREHREIPDIRPGYMVQLRVEVPDNKRRVSILKGTVIARRNAGLNTTIRIRRLVAGVGVESLLPLYSPNIKEIKVLDKKKVRRAKLYYVRGRMNALKK